MKEIAVDSNVLVSALLKGQEHYDEAVKLVEGLRQDEYLFIYQCWCLWRYAELS